MRQRAREKGEREGSPIPGLKKKGVVTELPELVFDGRRKKKKRKNSIHTRVIKPSKERGGARSAGGRTTCLRDYPGRKKEKKKKGDGVASGIRKKGRENCLPREKEVLSYEDKRRQSNSLEVSERGEGPFAARPLQCKRKGQKK